MTAPGRADQADTALVRSDVRRMDDTASTRATANRIGFAETSKRAPIEAHEGGHF